MRTGRLVSNAYCEVLSGHHSLVIVLLCSTSLITNSNLQWHLHRFYGLGKGKRGAHGKENSSRKSIFATKESYISNQS